MRRIFLYIIIFILFTGCSLKDEFILFNQTPSIQEGSRSENQNRVIETRLDFAQFEYKIRPHDRVSIMTYRHPELSTNTMQQNTNARNGLGQGLLVNSTGIIRLPLIENVKISGLTQTQARLEIENRFREYLKNPSVQLEVMNKRAYILGEVNNPGPITLANEQLPLLQLLSIAGDLTDSANRQLIVILKNQGDRVQTKVVNLTDINSIKTANQMIHPNDVIYVVPKGISIFNNKVNEVNPIFQLIADALTPFLTVRILTQ